jgi:hypothetical protein
MDPTYSSVSATKGDVGPPARRGGTGNMPPNRFSTVDPYTKGTSQSMLNTSEGKQADMFVRTSKYIAAYVGRVLPYGGDIGIAVETLQYPTIKPPDAGQECQKKK